MKISDYPKKMKVITGDSAWWYENRNKIDVVICSKSKEIVHATITRSALKKWIQKTER